MQYTDPTAIPSRAIEYGLLGVAVAFATSFPLALFVVGPGLGVTMDVWTSFMFAACASSVFGFVAGSVAGAAEPRGPASRAAAKDPSVTRLPAQSRPGPAGLEKAA